MITVSIAAISLGVGIDYVIHVIERFREEMEQSSNPASIKAVGGASGLALVGSALSDIAGLCNLPWASSPHLLLILRCNDRSPCGKHGTSACSIENHVDDVQPL